LELLSEESRKPSEVRHDFETYFDITEINFRVKSVPDKIEELKEKFSD
jgi:hypothetical protein